MASASAAAHLASRVAVSPPLARDRASNRLAVPRSRSRFPVRVSAASGGPPVGRLDDTAARERVMQLATGTSQGAGALEAVQGCLSSMPGLTNNRLMLFRHPGLKHPLDTVALNLVEPRWVVAFDALANAPRRPGDPPYCFGVTHPALVPPKTPPGEDPVPPKPGDVGMVCRVDDVYHDNKEERLYVTSSVVGRYRVDRVVGEHPFFVAETSRVVDETPGDDEGFRARDEAELKVWRLLERLDALAEKTGENGGARTIDYDMRRCSPVASERPAWDSNPPAEEERAEMFSWAVARRVGMDEAQHLEAARTVHTTARLAFVASALEEGVAYLTAVAALKDAQEGENAGEEEA